MEERYHVTTQNRFYPDMSNINKNITQCKQNLSAHLHIYLHIVIKQLMQGCPTSTGKGPQLI